jgi:hypothetical protein
MSDTVMLRPAVLGVAAGVPLMGDAVPAGRVAVEGDAVVPGGGGGAPGTRVAVAVWVMAAGAGAGSLLPQATAAAVNITHPARKVRFTRP